MHDLGLGIVVSLKDAFTANASRINQGMQSLDATVAASAQRMTRNLNRIQTGALAMGAGLAMLSLPVALARSTTATQKALGELRSLGVKDLRAIEDAAEHFTNQFAGTNKAQFITAAYDVRSALSGLTDHAVGTFTAMAALTAKATKATTEEMVGTFTTGYGIFKPLMPELDDSAWSRTFAGSMAQTVASFKTNGRQMADAIKNIGAVAASARIPLEEQLAILGQLQTTMPGSEAGTLYKAFMMKAAEAGQQLGLSFVDSTGRLKGVVPILELIRDRFPDLSQAKVQINLKKAFGSDEALKFVLQMSEGLGSFQSKIDQIARAGSQGTAVALQMAQSMNGGLGARMDLIRQQLKNLAEILGRELLPILLPVLRGVSRIILFFQKVAKASPPLTRAILTITTVIGGLTLAVGTILATFGTLGLALPTIKAGILALGATLGATVSSIGAFFWPVTLAITAVIASIATLRAAWSADFGGIRSTTLGFFENVGLVFKGTRDLITSLKDGTGQLSAQLAQKLEARGLMGLVVGLFQMYYRIRRFGQGIKQAFTQITDPIRKTLGPAVSAFMQSLGDLGRAITPIFRGILKLNNAPSSDLWHTWGRIVGTALGSVLRVVAFVARHLIEAQTRIIRTVTTTIRVVTTVGQVIAQTLWKVGRLAYRYVYPIRHLVEAFRFLGRTVGIVLDVLGGNLSPSHGIKAYGQAVIHYLGTPFRFVRNLAADAFGYIKSIVGAITQRVAYAFQWLKTKLTQNPIFAILKRLLGLSGDLGTSIQKMWKKAVMPKGLFKLPEIKAPTLPTIKTKPQEIPIITRLKDNILAKLPKITPPRITPIKTSVPVILKTIGDLKADGIQNLIQKARHIYDLTKSKLPQIKLKTPKLELPTPTLPELPILKLNNQDLDIQNINDRIARGLDEVRGTIKPITKTIAVNLITRAAILKNTINEKLATLRKTPVGITHKIKTTLIERVVRIPQLITHRLDKGLNTAKTRISHTFQSASQKAREALQAITPTYLKGPTILKPTQEKWNPKDLDLNILTKTQIDTQAIQNRLTQVREDLADLFTKTLKVLPALKMPILFDRSKLPTRPETQTPKTLEQKTTITHILSHRIESGIERLFKAPLLLIPKLAPMAPIVIIGTLLLKPVLLSPLPKTAQETIPHKITLTNPKTQEPTIPKMDLVPQYLTQDPIQLTRPTPEQARIDHKPHLTPESPNEPSSTPTPIVPTYSTQEINHAPAFDQDRLVADLVAALKDHPHQIRLTVELDGQQIAHAVYDDMTQDKIRNYQTL